MNVTDNNSNLGEQILSAAETLFAKKGFRRTSIRDITSKANCNLASVNYYFHGKENLYIEVFNRRMELLTRQRIRLLEQRLSNKKTINLELLIRFFAEVFLEPLLKNSSGQNFIKLLLQEMNEPHLPKGLFLNKVIQPLRNSMQPKLLSVCPELNQMEADLCLHSIAAQLITAHQAQNLFKGSDVKDMPFMNMKKVLSHIVRFSVAGVRVYAENKKTKK